jgi:hypothetical protein
MSCLNVLLRGIASLTGVVTLPSAYQVVYDYPAKWLLLSPGISSSGGNFAPLGYRIYQIRGLTPFSWVSGYAGLGNPIFSGSFNGESIIPWNQNGTFIIEIVGANLPANSQVDISYCLFDN